MLLFALVFLCIIQNNAATMNDTFIPLHKKKCVPCERGAKPLTRDAAEKMLAEVRLPGWQLCDIDGVLVLELNTTFIDFRSAVVFVNEVADVAEFEGHHPNIEIHSWNKVRIELFTHAVKGLSENDFILAAKIQHIVSDA
jgi:4a-hydroxytetrahydrobiopterin dehydratase